jgi:transporter family protein
MSGEAVRAGLLASWQFWAVLAAASAALTSLLAKVGLAGVEPNLATFLRTLVVVIALALGLLATGQLQGQALGSLPRGSLLALGLSGLATAVSWLCYFRALELGPVSRVAPIDKLSVVLVALLGVLVLGEQLSGRNWLGIALIALGGVLVALP